MTISMETPASHDPSPRATIPAEAEFILSALEAAQQGGSERRRRERRPYRVTASLKLFSDHPQAPPWEVFARDVSARGLGFITRHRLPLGYGGVLSILTPKNKVVKVDCTLVRCRQAVQGWFEGSMYFNREQAAFDHDWLAAQASS